MKHAALMLVIVIVAAVLVAGCAQPAWGQQANQSSNQSKNQSNQTCNKSCDDNDLDIDWDVQDQGEDQGNGDQGNGNQSHGGLSNITLAALPHMQATVGQAFSFSICQPPLDEPGATCGGLIPATNPTGGRPPYSFHVGFGSGFVPPGIALNLNGLLSGTPTLEGEYQFDACARDGFGDEGCVTVLITVEPAQQQEGEPAAQYATTIDSFTCTYTRTDSYGDKHYELRASGTATGGPGSELQLVFNPGYFTEPTSSCPTCRTICTTWLDESELQNCARGGGPDTTAWSVFVADSEVMTGFTMSLVNYEIELDARIFVNNNLAAETTATAKCPE
jgi:hypothetical protein